MKNEKRMIKEDNSNSGRSACDEFPNGRRRKQEGKERAPKSARRGGTQWMTDCTENQLKKAGLA